MKALTQKQIDFLDRYVNGSWNLNTKTGRIDTRASVDISRLGLKSIPVSFGRVSGNFDCRINKLTSLNGAPQSVGRGFYCSYNNLTSLKGAPQSVGGDFDCSWNKLTSLEGGPQSVGGIVNIVNI